MTTILFILTGSLPTYSAHVSPPLAWACIPSETKSLALIVDDPDAPDPAAPKMTWVHWVLYNLPPTAAGLSEAVALRDLPSGAREGLNGMFADLGYDRCRGTIVNGRTEALGITSCSISLLCRGSKPQR